MIFRVEGTQRIGLFPATEGLPLLTFESSLLRPELAKIVFLVACTWAGWNGVHLREESRFVTVGCLRNYREGTSCQNLRHRQQNMQLSV
jgi:hypothetical protein